MAHSNITGSDEVPQQAAGRGTADLGPSDSSDSGSDIAGTGGFGRDTEDDFESGSTSDTYRAGGAGADLGDAGLDSDSDSRGTGERRAAGRDDPGREAADISPDQITRDPGGLLGGEDREGIGLSSDHDDPRRSGELDLSEDLEDGRYGVAQEADVPRARGAPPSGPLGSEALGSDEPENEQAAERDQGSPVGGGGGEASRGRSAR